MLAERAEYNTWPSAEPTHSRGGSWRRLKRSPSAEAVGFDDDQMQSFESCRPSQPVRSPPANNRRPLKTTRYRDISQIPRGLRVGNWATEVLFWPLVSEAAFWCLVFAGRMDPGPSHRNERSSLGGFSDPSTVGGPKANIDVECDADRGPKAQTEERRWSRGPQCAPTILHRARSSETDPVRSERARRGCRPHRRRRCSSHSRGTRLSLQRAEHRTSSQQCHTGPPG
jgi:hypothetical protein